MILDNQSLNQVTQQTLLSSTRVNATDSSLVCRLDWFQGSFPTRYFNKVKRLAETLFGFGEFVEREGKGLRYFTRSWQHPSEAFLAQVHRSPSGTLNPDLSYLEFKGEVIGYVKQKKLYKFIRFLIIKCEFHCTRIDADIDDYAKRLNVFEVFLAGNAEKFTGFKPKTFKFNLEGTRNGSEGAWVSFGHRGDAGCGKYVSIYDKSKESKGKTDCVRIEVSYSNHYAEQFVGQLVQVPCLLWGDLFKSWILGTLDFVDRKDGFNDRNPQRRPRLEFWDRIFKDTTKIKPCKKYKKPTVDSVMEWINYQVAPSLALIFEVFDKRGVDSLFSLFIYLLVTEGRKRLKPKHFAIIDSS